MNTESNEEKCNCPSPECPCFCDCHLQDSECLDCKSGRHKHTHSSQPLSEWQVTEREAWQKWAMEQGFTVKDLDDASANNIYWLSRLELARKEVKQYYDSMKYAEGLVQAHKIQDARSEALDEATDMIKQNLCGEKWCTEYCLILNNESKMCPHEEADKPYLKILTALQTLKDTSI